MSRETEIQQPQFVECKHCDGMGEVIWDDEDGHFEELCDVCKGACEVLIEKKANTIMTNEQINERIASLCGWKVSSNNEVWRSPDSKTIQNGPPSYHSSLDACREFESKFTGDNRSLYMDMIYLFVGAPKDELVVSNFDNHWAMFNATPLQRCEAFLRMKGQWDDIPVA